MRGMSGRDGEDLAPAVEVDRQRARAAAARSASAWRARRGSRDGPAACAAAGEERGRGEQHGDEAERPSHRAVESRQPAGRREVAVAFRAAEHGIVAAMVSRRVLLPICSSRRSRCSGPGRRSRRRRGSPREPQDGAEAATACRPTSRRTAGGNSAPRVANRTGGRSAPPTAPAAARGARRRASTAGPRRVRAARGSPSCRTASSSWLASSRRRQLLRWARRPAGGGWSGAADDRHRRCCGIDDAARRARTAR